MSSPEAKHEPSKPDPERNRSGGDQGSGAGYGFTDLSSADLQRVTILLLAGLIVRLLYVALVRHDPLFFSAFLDADAYRSWAESIVKTGSLWPDVPEHMPFYSYVNAGLLLLFDRPWTPLYVLQTIAGLFTACLVFLLGRTLFRRPAGYMGMALFLFHPDWIVLETRPVPAVWVGCSVALGVLALVYAVRSNRPRWFWLIGSSFCFVFAAGMVGQVLFVLPVLLLWFAFCFAWSVPERLAAATVWGIPPVLLVCAVLFLNYRTMNQSYDTGGWLLQADAGRALYAGSGPDATGYPPARPGLRHERIRRMASDAGEHPAERQQFYLTRTWDHVSSHPLRVLKTKLRTVFYLMSNHSIETTEPVSALKNASGLFPLDPVPFGFFVVLGAVGLLRTFVRGGPSTGVSITVLALFVGPLLTGASVRARMVALPLLSVLSGHGVLFVATALQTVNGKQLAWIVPLSAVCMIGFVPLLQVEKIEERAYLDSYWRARAEWNDGAVADAIETLKTGRANARLDWKQRVHLDYLYVKYIVELRSNEEMGQQVSTPDPLIPLTHLVRTVKQQDLHFPEVFALMGRVRRNADQHEEAVRQFRKSLKQKPNPDVWRQIGETLIEAEKYKEAVKEMAEALKTFPDCGRCRLIRARALGLEGNWTEAVQELETVIQHARDRDRAELAARAHFYAGYVNERTGHPDRAFHHYEKAMKHDGDSGKKARERAENLREQIENDEYGKGGTDD